MMKAYGEEEGHLRRIAPQVQAVERIVTSLHRSDAARRRAMAIGKPGKVILRSHVQACVTDALRSGDEHECKRKVDEMVAILGRRRRLREQSP